MQSQLNNLSRVVAGSKVTTYWLHSVGGCCPRGRWRTCNTPVAVTGLSNLPAHKCCLYLGAYNCLLLHKKRRPRRPRRRLYVHFVVVALLFLFLFYFFSIFFSASLHRRHRLDRALLLAHPVAPWSL